MNREQWINKILLSNRPYYDKLYLVAIVNNMQRENGNGKWVFPVPKSWLQVAGGNHPDKEFVNTFLTFKDKQSFYVNYAALLRVDGDFPAYHRSGVFND